ncbi:MAG: L-fucose isomerase [Anaerococcus vaginalis]|uniref:L-fucose isomerase n=1 Tax=Anaerococcus TaxID=165779 RepID=UPI0008A58F54|nr:MULTISPECIES: L-fucose isomerase [Anaerococcus]MDU5085982.1 L-fucose isomerase [Anaerococcus vaginalis]OFL13964.1 L-fucose isomerase [Anaerococcus sp. HMSC068A02]
MTHPRIGIRPIIDGRWGGVRESLEEQTMNMAHLAKELIESNLRYADGDPVECVISNTTIGGSYEAKQCAEQFSTENVVATLSVTSCWCYGTETMDLDPKTLKAVWGLNATERPGAVYLAAVMSAYAQRGLPAFSIYGSEVQEADDNSITDDVKEKILRFARAAIAVGQMRDKAYVNIGAISMGIAGSDANALFFQNYLGMRTEWVDMTEILRRMKLGIYDHEEFEKAKKWQKEYIKEGFNINETLDLQENLMRSKVVPYEEEWDFCLKHALIVRDILFGNPKLAEIGWSEEALGKNAIAGGFQGQRQWTDWLPNADFTESIMASTFDWNGPKAPTAFATENDTLNGVAMLFGTLLTNRAPIFSDVRTYWSKDSVKRVTGYQLEGKGQDGIIHLINSGATCLDATGAAKDEDGNSIMKHFWDLKDEDIKAMLDNTDWCQANHQYFRGGGFSSHFRTNAEMPVTMVRVNMVEGVGPTIQIAEGYTVNLPDKESQILEDRTDRTWPTTWFAPRLGMEGFESVYKVMANWGANHGATVYGHVGADFITLASMLRIPVSLHNVEDKDVFRPQTFNGFGTKDLESVDYRACEYFGPLYKG